MEYSRGGLEYSRGGLEPGTVVHTSKLGIF